MLFVSINAKESPQAPQVTLGSSSITKQIVPEDQHGAYSGCFSLGNFPIEVRSLVWTIKVAGSSNCGP